MGTTQFLMEPTQQLMRLPETQAFVPQTQAMTKTQMLMAGYSGVQPVKLATPTAPIFNPPETITQKMMMETQPQNLMLQSQIKMSEPCSSDSAIASDDRLYEPLTSSQTGSVLTDELEEEEIEEVKIQRAKSTSRPWKPPGLTRATRKSNKTRTARPWRPFFADEES
ncbi:unnamed protein product [Oikopleura dioica]|uniref:Uncharacterized protein n=1 Tax=Oikopleura dioica TaxID=34765 RepID=E4WSG5_OIKDI|nr:unnamed protein product [Oikopleura dioica]